MEKREPSHTTDENVRWCSHYGKQYGGSSRNWKIELPYDRAIPLLGILLCKGIYRKRIFKSFGIYIYIYQFSSVQFSHSVVSDSLRPHELQHARPPCPSSTPGVHSDSRPLIQWCHPAISSSVVPFSSCPNPSQHQGLFQWVNSSHEVAKVLEFQL